GGNALIAGDKSRVRRRGGSGFTLLVQLAPHLNHSGPQLGRQLAVVAFGWLRHTRRINRISKRNVKTIEALQKLLSSRPDLVESIDCHRNDRYLQMKRQNRRTLFEYLRCAIDTALPFGKQEEDPAVA